MTPDPPPAHRLSRLLLLLALVLLSARTAQGDWPPPGRELPADLDEGRWFLDLTTADGEPLRLYTDTGGGMVLRRAAAERLGLAEAGAEEAATSVELPDLAEGSRIPPAPAPLWLAADGESPPFLPDGMLGAPWFAGRRWTFDYSAERLLFHDEPFEVPKELAGRSVELGFQRDEAGEATTGFPRITAVVDGGPIELLFDTGATSVPPPAFGEEGAVAVSFVTRSTADAWRAAHPEWTVVGEGADGVAEAGDDLPDGYWIQVPELEIAGIGDGLPLGPVWFVTRDDANFHDYMSQWMDRQVDGALGGNALSGLVVTVDYPRARIILQGPIAIDEGSSLTDVDRAGRLSRIGLAAYRAGHHAEAGRLLALAGRLGIDKVNVHYNAACAFALAGPEHHERAMDQLRRAVVQGLRDPDPLRRDDDLATLRHDPDWRDLVEEVEANAAKHAEKAGDPDRAELVTEDVERFWAAYDAAAEGPDDLAARAGVYRYDYLERGSSGLIDFYASRIRSAEALARTVEENRAYYDAIRPRVRLTEDQAATIRAAFHRLAEIYPAATFPDVYFLVGRLNSGGTTSADSLLIGMELFGLAADTPAGVIPAGAANMVKPAARIPYIVAHELIHAQQTGGGSGDLLYQALREGGADFLAELILPADGWEPNYRTWGRGHADRVRERFLADLETPRDGGGAHPDWFYNYSQEDPDWFADLGYYVGYEIARGYYEAADDETAAVRDLIRLDDPQAILEASGYRERAFE